MFIESHDLFLAKTSPETLNITVINRALVSKKRGSAPKTPKKRSEWKRGQNPKPHQKTLLSDLIISIYRFGVILSVPEWFIDRPDLFLAKPHQKP